MGYPDPATIRAYHGTGAEEEDNLRMDPSASALLAMDHVHHQIHEGNLYHFSTLSTALANAGTIDLIWYTGATPAHLAFDGACGCDARMDFFEGPTATTQSVRTLRCLNRVVGDGGASSTLTVVSVMASDGTHLQTLVMTTGSGLGSSGRGVGPRHEWVCAPSTKYLIRLTNLGGVANLAAVTVEAYEHTPIN